MPHEMTLEVFPPLRFFGKVEKDCVNPSLNVWDNSSVKPFNPGLSCFGEVSDCWFNFFTN